MGPRTLRIALVVSGFAMAGVAGYGTAVPGGRERRWMAVVRDSEYTIAIDTARITRTYGRAYVAWYRTDHARTHAVNGGSFNREVVQAIVMCEDPVTFKIASVDLSLGTGPPVSRQRTNSTELFRQRWRGVGRGTVEERVAKVTCGMAKGRR